DADASGTLSTRRRLACASQSVSMSPTGAAKASAAHGRVYGSWTTLRRCAVAPNAFASANPYFTAASEHSLKSVGTRMVFSLIMMASLHGEAATVVPPLWLRMQAVPPISTCECRISGGLVAHRRKSSHIAQAGFVRHASRRILGALRGNQEDRRLT